MEVWLCDGVCVCGGRGFGMREGQRFERGDIDFNEEVYNKNDYLNKLTCIIDKLM